MKILKNITEKKNLKKKEKEKKKKTQMKITQISVKTLVNLHQKLEFSNQIQLRKHKQVEGSCIVLFMAFTIYYASR